jgi:hypothetical protein
MSSMSVTLWPLLREFEQHAGIDGAAACRHHQAVQRAEAGGGLDAAAVEKGAQAGAGAEMRHDDAPLRPLRRDLGQLAGDELVGQAVEAVAPDDVPRHRVRQRDQLRQRGHVVMKPGVEAGHLRQGRARGENRTDRRQVHRHVQRVERGERFKLRQQARRYQLGSCVIGPTMHDAVANRGQHGVAEMGIDEIEQRVQHGVETAGAVGGPAPLGDDVAVAVARPEMGGTAQGLDLAAQHRVETGGAVERELHAGGACVERQDS